MRWLRRVPWHLWLGAALVAAIAAAAVAAPLLTSADPLREWAVRWIGDRLLPAPFGPSDVYPLGSDQLGRDVWANLLYGARTTLGIAALVVTARLIAGVALGAVAGWWTARWPDRLVSVLIDAFAAFPTVLFAMLWILAFDIRSGARAFVLALALTGWWAFGRTTRSALVAIRGADWLEAARALGLSDFAVFVRHVMPNLLPLLAVTTALEASAVLLALGELGLLGFVVGGGQQSFDERRAAQTVFFGAPEWGGILAQGRFEFLRHPWIALSPALAFALAIFGFNLTGHGLRALLERSPLGLAWLFRRRTVVAIAAVVLAGRVVLPNVGPAAAYAPIAERFDAARAHEHLAYIADPARGGRLTGSRGYLEAATYVADRFRELGLVPIGDDGTYFQRFGTDVVDLQAEPELAIFAPQKEATRPGEAPTGGTLPRGRPSLEPVRFTPRDDFSELVGGRRGGGVAEGDVVFAGAGIHAREYTDYRDVDPRGKVVLLVPAPTRGVDPVETARRLGAVGVLIAGGPGPLIHFSYLPLFEQETLPTILVSQETADRLIEGSGRRIADLRQKIRDRLRRQQTRPTLRDEPPEPLSFETTTRVRLSVPLGAPRHVEGIDVVGLLPPSQPSDRERYVLVGGHLDGVGTDPDGAVYPAANDNGSGVAVTIEVARVIASQRDRLRAGVIFVAFAGEEEGLRGSEQFVQKTLNSPYRPQNLAAYLNLDTDGCCGDELAASEESFALHARLAAAAERHGVPFTYGGGSSDHATFVRRGVPAVLLSWSDFSTIHTARDTVESVEPWRLRAVGVVAAQAVLELALGD